MEKKEYVKKLEKCSPDIFAALSHPTMPRRRHTCNYLSVEEIKLKGDKPAPRHAHAAVYHPTLDVGPACYSNTIRVLIFYVKTLFIIGGFNEDGVELNDVWAFSLRTYTWTQIERMKLTYSAYYYARQQLMILL